MRTGQPFSSRIDELPSRPKRVLVVEDEWVIARDLTELLHRLGHVPVGYAATSSDAIRLAAAQRPDLILMDVQLKGPVDGVATAKEIVRQQKVPIIYITANSQVFLEGNAEMVPPYTCIAKPFSEQCVQAAIESLACSLGSAHPQ